MAHYLIREDITLLAQLYKYVNGGTSYV